MVSSSSSSCGALGPTLCGGSTGSVGPTEISIPKASNVDESTGISATLAYARSRGFLPPKSIALVDCATQNQLPHDLVKLIDMYSFDDFEKVAGSRSQLTEELRGRLIQLLSSPTLCFPLTEIALSITIIARRQIEARLEQSTISAEDMRFFDAMQDSILRQTSEAGIRQSFNRYSSVPFDNEASVSCSSSSSSSIAITRIPQADPQITAFAQMSTGLKDTISRQLGIGFSVTSVPDVLREVTQFQANAKTTAQAIVHSESVDPENASRSRKYYSAVIDDLYHEIVARSLENMTLEGQIIGEKIIAIRKRLESNLVILGDVAPLKRQIDVFAKNSELIAAMMDALHVLRMTI